MNEQSLDFSADRFRELLDKSSEMVLRHHQDLNGLKGHHYHEQHEVESWFDEPIPQQGMDIDDLFSFVENRVIKTSTGNLGPHMYAYVMAGGNQIGILADKLASTINQNVAKWHLAPAISEIDKRVVQWASDLIGFGNSAGGFIGSSGSSANLDGLTVARNIYFEKNGVRENGLFGMKPFVVYCSDETHNSVDKAVQLLGIGAKQLRRIATNDDFTINIKALRQQIEEDIQNDLQPFCIIGNAGTVNTGAIDDLVALSEIARSNEMWFHVDGAYGGLASCLDSKRHLYHGIDMADSVALDFHKWLYQPFEVGCLLVKGWSILNRTYYKEATYLDNSLEQTGRLNFNEHHFLLSRSAKSLKVWMSIKAYGIQKIKAMIQKDIDLTNYLNNQIRNSSDLELIATSPLAISCFRYKGGLKNEDQIIQMNQKLIPALEKDGRVFITGTRLKGEFVLRACLINHRKTKATTDYLLEVIREVGSQILPQQ